MSPLVVGYHFSVLGLNDGTFPFGALWREKLQSCVLTVLSLESFRSENENEDEYEYEFVCLELVRTRSCP